MLKYTVILEPENTGGYSVHCPSMPGCIAQGENKESAIEKLSLDRHYKYMLFFGIIRKYKGLDLLLKAFAYFKELDKLEKKL